MAALRRLISIILTTIQVVLDKIKYTQFHCPYIGMGEGRSLMGAEVSKFHQKFPLWVGYFGPLISRKSFSQKNFRYSPPLKASARLGLTKRICHFVYCESQKRVLYLAMVIFYYINKLMNKPDLLYHHVVIMSVYYVHLYSYTA